MLVITQLITALKKMFSTPTYGENLEHYITSRHPKDTSDVENFTRDFQLKQAGAGLWM